MLDGLQSRSRRCIYVKLRVELWSFGRKPISSPYTVSATVALNQKPHFDYYTCIQGHLSDWCIIHSPRCGLSSHRRAEPLTVQLAILKTLHWNIKAERALQHTHRLSIVYRHSGNDVTYRIDCGISRHSCEVSSDNSVYGAMSSIKHCCLIERKGGGRLCPLGAMPAPPVASSTIIHFSVSITARR
jgi:hypothetical protein